MKNATMIRLALTRLPGGAIEARSDDMPNVDLWVTANDPSELSAQVQETIDEILHIRAIDARAVEVDDPRAGPDELIWVIVPNGRGDSARAA